MAQDPRTGRENPQSGEVVCVGAPRGSFRRTSNLAAIFLAVLSLLLTVLSAPASAEDRPFL